MLLSPRQRVRKKFLAWAFEKQMFFALSMNIHKVSVQGRRERRGGAGGAPAPPPFPTMSWSKKKFFHVKLENIKFS